MRLLTWTAALLMAFAALTTVPAATAQSSVSIVIEGDDPPTLLRGEEAQQAPLDIRVFYPLLTACLEYEPVQFSAQGPPVLDLKLNPVAVVPNPGPAPFGAESSHEVNLTVTLNQRVPAYELLPVTFGAEGGGCAMPGGPYGDSGTFTLVYRSAYEPDLRAETVSVEPSEYGLQVWTIRFTNQANAATLVNLAGEEGVDYRNLAESLVVPAPSEDEPAPSTDLEVLVDNPGPGAQEATLHYEYRADVPMPEDEPRSWTGEVSALIPPSSESNVSASSDDVAASELPGFEVIPLLAVLGVAVLLRRRR